MEFFKSFSLFNDIEDKAIQAFNRGRVLANMVMDHSKNGKFSVKAVALSAGYVNCIPKNERKAAIDEFVKHMDKEGFSLGGTQLQQDFAIQRACNG